MRKVIHWIHFPLIASAVVWVSGDNAIHDRVAEVHIWMRHIYFCTQNHRAIRKFAFAHTLEEVEVFFYRAVAVWTICARSSRRTFLFCNLFSRLFVNVCFTLFDEADCKVVELLEIVRCVINIFPLVAQPFNIFLNRIYIFNILFHRVSVIKTEVTCATKAFSNTKVEADCFSVTNM